MIPVVDLQRHHAGIAEGLEGALRRVVRSGWYILGPEVEAFESEFARWVGGDACVGVASGTDAITLALRALGIGPGDEVITVAHTAVATVVGIVNAGARPILVDVDERSYTMDVEACARAVTARTRAIVPVHLYGHPANMPALMEIARRHGLRVVEDCAQAHGAVCAGRRVGTWGDCGAFSFYPTKNLGGLGDGGAVVTNDRDVAERVRLLRQYGWKERYVSSEHGTNSRLDELQAAILRLKLRYVDSWNRRRREHAEGYTARLREYVCVPQVREDCEHVYHLYVIRSRRRDALAAWLKAHGVGTAIHYPVPVHKQPAYRHFASMALRVTERIAGEILSLPMFAELTEEEREKVSEAVRAFSEQEGSAA
ncbi:MAG: DegT/DnrJ/EryC1/StrS family aminotransferase [bacterium]|nr:DegT/DnrJ/EryC1/StrS family aminotransferase [bacterium]